LTSACFAFYVSSKYLCLPVSGLTQAIAILMKLQAATGKQEGRGKLNRETNGRTEKIQRRGVSLQDVSAVIIAP
jgi:hypothetical protein